MKEISKEDKERIEKEARLAVLKIARKEGFNEGIEAAVIKLKALQIESHNYHDKDIFEMVEKLKKNT